MSDPQGSLGVDGRVTGVRNPLHGDERENCDEAGLDVGIGFVRPLEGVDEGEGVDAEDTSRI